MFRCVHAILSVLLLSGPPLLAQTGVMIKSAVPPKKIEPIEMILSPARIDVPVLKRRLIPSSAVLTPGNAAPIYLRLRHELPEETWNAIANCSRWNDLPLDQFPKAEARTLVYGMSSRLRQLEYGTRRSFCDWSYTLPEQQLDRIEIMLPDAQAMRNWARLLQCKARLEMLEGNYEACVRTIETDIAFGRHVGEGPFLINTLIAVAIDTVGLATAEELMTRPGAPNLYWALTALPRPLIDTRHSLETESKLIDTIVPELADPDASRTDAGWSVHLERLHARLQTVAKDLVRDDPKMTNPIPPDLAAFTAAVKPAAIAYLTERSGLSRQKVDAMPAGQLITTYLSAAYREGWDEALRVGYLPFAEGLAAHRQAEARPRPQEPTLRLLMSDLIPAIDAVLWASARLERRVAALRIIEAIRLYAAANGGKLPDSLDQISEVPIPVDPATNRPFGYKRDGEHALLTEDLLARAAVYSPSYRITIRKDAAEPK